MDFLDRTRGLIGPDNLKKLAASTVLVAGLGGVGGIAAECLARSGIGHLILIDFDVINISNCNRQIIALRSTLGASKVDVLTKRLLDLNPGLKITGHKIRLDKTSIPQVVQNVDFIIDAIDDTDAKVELALFAQAQRIQHLMALGMGNRLDPQAVCLTTLEKTQGDPLARKLRGLIRKRGLELSAINVVYSPEAPRIKLTPVQSMMAVPATAGLLLAATVINQLID